MAQSDAYRILEVIRQAIDQQTKNGAEVEYSYGEIADASLGYMVSAYINGNYESASEDFRVPAQYVVNAGDYGFFAENHRTGSKWMVEPLANSLYAKLAININDGAIYTGDGSSVPSTPFGRGGRAFSFFGG